MDLFVGNDNSAVNIDHKGKLMVVFLCLATVGFLLHCKIIWITISKNLKLKIPSLSDVAILRILGKIKSSEFKSKIDNQHQSIS